MRKKILAIIGAGEAAFPIIDKAKELDILTIGFGEKNSLARNRVDFFIEKSIFDIAGIVDECRKHNVNGVIASSEITTESAAIIADELQLPGNDIKNGFFARNKYLMRERVKTISSINQPKYYIYDGNPVEKFPVMVKAVDACGKKGIKLVKNEVEFEDAIKLSAQISSNGEVLIEEYLDGGKEYSIECIASNRDCFIIQVTEKITSGEPYFTEIAHHQPADLSDEIRKKIEVATKNTLEVLGIKCGMAHMEIKIIDNQIYFIEVGARAGGDHIADVLTVNSTNYDYYKAAIDCCFDCLEKKEIKNIAYTGIYFHCKENEHLKRLFADANKADWCIVNTVENDCFLDAKGNVEASNSGYIIYKSDHRITLKDTSIMNLRAERINEYENAFDLIWNHNKEIGRTLSDDELKKGIEKFLNFGNVISIVDDNRIVAFLMLYCNNIETLEAYICNVYVLNEYRGLGLSKKVLEKAISVCKSKHFTTIKLHVAKDNITAINLYEQYGFLATGNNKENDNELQMEMVKFLG
ncbi:MULTISPECIES: GNAT family N-acetyltransferase [Coprobacillaceae]|uniref:GNAT family N-acetyltransferase n=1 Tax=Coprobacillaceae TaxID=2810280 RepID=UPI000E5024E3|nr:MULTISPECIES: GNAT family N-acetyltransferase [Coprobacillaceae]RHM62813.1 GNAT family N-acetyltransferase [Coprobacillus sp. AF33-1AC]RHS96110.1 GNAT family N-acetyltransferase [Erysipelatoclostridium sp. AM42-17]